MNRRRPSRARKQLQADFPRADAHSEVRMHVLSVVAALVLAGIMIGGMSALGYNTIVGTVSLTVLSSITISFSGSNSTVNFLSLASGASNDTTTNNPYPFVIENDGNVKVNVTIGATNLWNTSANPSTNYRFAASSNGEGQCFDPIGSNTSATNMPPTAGAGRLMAYLNYTDTCDEAEVNIYVTAPSGEGAGAKTSTVALVSSQAS